MALEIVGKHSVEVLNSPVADLFVNGERSELVKGLKLVKRQTDIQRYTFYATFNSRVIATQISSIRLKSEAVGWVILLHQAH
jgi:hypothetical protein